ncbi:major facilitator superfamily domain-containing protein [Blastocladiella britannica]|nr:major facilitator superfamily domain-containing protein [Blastocladiella britannica]
MTSTKTPEPSAVRKRAMGSPPAQNDSEKTSSTALTPEQRKKIMRTVFFALLVDIFSFTIILPLFPRLLEYYKQNEASDPTSLFSWTLRQLDAFKALLGIRGTRLDVVLFGGALGSLFSLLQFAVSPHIGRLSDKLGRKRVLMLCMAGNLASCFLWIIAKPFWVFVASRVVGGLSEGNVQLSVAMISDVTTPETRSRGLALVGIAFALGFTFGPAVGAALASHDLTGHSAFLDSLGLNPYSASALLAFLLILAEIVYLHRSMPETLVRRIVPAAKPNTTTTITAAVPNTQTSSTRLGTLSSLHFAYLFLFSGLEFTLPFYTYDMFAYTNAQQGALLGFIGLVASAVQGGYTRRRGHAIGEEKIVVQGVTTCAVAFALIAANSGSGSAVTSTATAAGWSLWAAATLLAFTSATVVTCLMTLASLECRRSSDARAAAANAPIGDSEHEDGSGDDEGSAMGSFRAWGQLGRAIGPLVTCSAYWIVGARTTYAVGSVALFAVSLWVHRVGKGIARDRKAALGKKQ